MSSHLRFQQRHQLALHVIKLIRNIEAHDTLAVEVFAELLRKFTTVHFLHHKNAVGPRNLLRGELHVRIIIEPRRIRFHTRPLRKHHFRRGAAALVLAADEKRVGQFAVARSLARTRMLSLFNCPQAAMMSLPRGVRTGLAYPALFRMPANTSITSQSEHS